MLQSKGKRFLKDAQNFERHAEPGEVVLASVQIGLYPWFLTNKRLISMNAAATKVKAASNLESITKVRTETDRLGQKVLFVTEYGGSEAKIGAVLDVGDEFLELLKANLPNLISQDFDSGPSPSALKKSDKAEARERKREEKRELQATNEANYGKEVLFETLGLKFVRLFAKGYVRVGVSNTYEKLLGVEGSADNLQKKSAAGRAAGFVFTGGLNMLGSNKRGDLFLTITTDRKVHTIHVESPYAHDIKSFQRIVSVGKSLLAGSQESSPLQAESTKVSVSEELERLVALRESGVLSEEEFQKAKGQVLGS